MSKLLQGFVKAGSVLGSVFLASALVAGTSASSAEAAAPHLPASNGVTIGQSLPQATLGFAGIQPFSPTNAFLCIYFDTYFCD